MVSGILEITAEKISAIIPGAAIGDADYDYSGLMLIPGFIDIHVHGWGRGSYIFQGTASSIGRMAEDLPRAGVTAFLASSGAAAPEFIEQSMQAAAEYIASTHPAGGAECLGIHFEGPFLNIEQCGMQNPEYIVSPDIGLFEHYQQLANNSIRLVTLAPELPGGLELVKHLRANAVTVSAGHTAATFDEMALAVACGVQSFTHTFSGMRGLHHREPGVVGAALYFDQCYCEVAKQTGMTVRPEVFTILYRIKTADKIIHSTDCVGYGDMQDGAVFKHYLRQAEFSVEGTELVMKTAGKTERYNRLDYNVVKDIELSYIQSVRNIIANVHPSVPDVIKMTAENPAKLIGVFDRKGSITVGKDADLLVVNTAFELQAVFCNGRKINVD